MPRPTKMRKVDFFPTETYFKPLGKKQCELEEVTIKVEELEAMRLKDIEGLSQEECAIRMEVSRQTFQNILDEARRKTTLALVEGKALHITGGDFTAKTCAYECKSCKKIYPLSYEIDRERCPVCGSTEVVCSRKQKPCHKWCQG